MISLVSKNLRCLILKHTFKSPVTGSLHFFSASTLSDKLLHKHNFPPELASRVASQLSRLNHQQKLENADSVLSFLKGTGFSNAQLLKLVKIRARVLAANLGTIKPKIEVFQNEGFSSDDIPSIISVCPTILSLSVERNIIPSLSVLKGLFGSNEAVAKVIRRSHSRRLFSSNLEKTVLPNVELLNSYGIPMSRIRIVLRDHPNCFVLKPEIVRKSAEKAVEMGLNPSSKMFMYAIPVIAKLSNEAWELKLQAFRNMGFSDGDILSMFKKAPRVFSGSVEKINKIKDLLLATGKYNMPTIVNRPESLMFSIDKRFEPRLRILRLLESRGLIKDWPTLVTISFVSDGKFFKQFISPYLNDISDVCIPEYWGKKVSKPSS